MNGQANNDAFVRVFSHALIAVNKQLVAHGEKDMLKETLREAMRNYGIREELETRVRELVQHSRGADNVDLDNLRSNLTFLSLPEPIQKDVQTIENSLTERIKDFTRTLANQ